MKLKKGRNNTAVKGVIYGPEGVGKSTLASRFPDPLFIDLEGGTNQLSVKRVDEKITTYDDFLKILKEVKRDPKICKTLIIDTADMAEILARRKVCEEKHVERLDDIGYHKGYPMTADEIQKLLNELTQMTVNLGINVFFVAHSKITKFELPDENGAYDRYELNVDKLVAPLLKQWADVVLFLNYKVNVVRTGDGFNKKYKATGGERVIYTTHSPTWDAKNRFGLPEELPLEYSKIKIIFEEQESGTGIEEPTEELVEQFLEEPVDILDDPDFTLIPDEDADDEKLKDIVGDPTVAKILSRLTESGLTEKDAISLIGKKAKPIKGTGKKLADYDTAFLKLNVLNKWDSFKIRLEKIKEA